MKIVGYAVTDPYLSDGQQIEKAERFVVPPLGGYCEIRYLSHHAEPPESGTTNFFDLLMVV